MVPNFFCRSVGGNCDSKVSGRISMATRAGIESASIAARWTRYSYFFVTVIDKDFGVDKTFAETLVDIFGVFVKDSSFCSVRIDLSKTNNLSTS